jgi:hypothetical protein
MQPTATTYVPLTLQHRQGALALEAELEGRLATRVESFRSGLALFRDDLPRVAELNVLRIDPSVEVSDPADLLDFVDHLQAGLPQRSIRVVEDDAAEALRAPLAAAGWVVRRVSLLVKQRPPTHPVDTDDVAPIDPLKLAGAREATLRRTHRDLESAEQMAAIGTMPAEGVDTRAYAAVVGTDIAAYAIARRVGDAAKLTEVDANERAFGKGLGRAVVWGAVRALRAEGVKLVVAEAGDDSWGKWTFHRLGFEEVGHVHRLIRPWG